MRDPREARRQSFLFDALLPNVSNLDLEMAPTRSPHAESRMPGTAHFDTHHLDTHHLDTHHLDTHHWD